MRSSNELTYEKAKRAAYGSVNIKRLRKAASYDAERFLKNPYLLRGVTNTSMLRARAQLAKGVW